MAARVVYLLVTYNQAPFVAEAMRSALAQDHAGLEILVSDDCSDDGTFAILEEEANRYGGPHKITLARNPVRLGSVDHTARLGDLIGADAFVVTAHGDDTSVPARTTRLVETWRREKVAMVSSDCLWSSDGRIETRPLRPARRISAREMIEVGWVPEMLGAALGFESRLLTDFPRLDGSRLAWGLDHVLPLRAAASRGFFFLSERLITYRRHPGNMSNAIADRTGPQRVFDEGLLSYAMAIRHWQRLDLLANARRRRVSPSSWLLLRDLERRMFFDLGRWAGMRAELKAAKMTPTWIPMQDLAGRRIVWDATW